jgi:hypothetical protein
MWCFVYNNEAISKKLQEAGDSVGGVYGLTALGCLKQDIERMMCRCKKL